MQQRLSYQQKIQIYSMKRQSENQCFMIYKVAKIGYLEMRKHGYLQLLEICGYLRYAINMGISKYPKILGILSYSSPGILDTKKIWVASTQFAWVSSNTVANWALGKYPTLGS